jgi:hypothetical protein
MPRGFSEPGKLLCLRRSLYGLKQSPRNFFQYLKSNLEKSLFVTDKVFCFVYVDDTLLWSRKKEWIDEAIIRLESTGMALEVEQSVFGFLGVHIDRDQVEGSIKLTQTGLMEILPMAFSMILVSLGCLVIQRPTVALISPMPLVLRSDSLTLQEVLMRKP